MAQELFQSVGRFKTNKSVLRVGLNLLLQKSILRRSAGDKKRLDQLMEK